MSLWSWLEMELMQWPLPDLDPWLSNWFMFIWKLEDGQWPW